MGKRKWGESFLKSGLPLEHLTLMTFKSMEFDCSPNIEYQRSDESGQKTWFELDLYACSPNRNKDTYLSFLVESKYHDLSRFWVFLPCETERWHFDDRVFNCGPFQTLSKPTAKTALKLAPLSYSGIVVSEDGLKQENSVYAAIQQVANAFVPQSLSVMFGYLLDVQKGHIPKCEALIPLIVTNARLFRLKPNVTDLEEIRKATVPEQIADELEWTWCYFDPSMDLINRNLRVIEEHQKKETEVLDRFPISYARFELWLTRPNWVAIVNISALPTTIETIFLHFLSMKTCTVSTALKRDRKVRII